MVTLERTMSTSSSGKRISGSLPIMVVGAGMGTHVAAAIMLAAAVLFLAWVRVATLHLGYELSRLRAEQDVLLEHSRALQVEIGTLRAPARLMELATGQLNMVPPQDAVVVGRKGARP